MGERLTATLAQTSRKYSNASQFCGRFGRFALTHGDYLQSRTPNDHLTWRKHVARWRTKARNINNYCSCPSSIHWACQQPIPVGLMKKKKKHVEDSTDVKRTLRHRKCKNQISTYWWQAAADCLQSQLWNLQNWKLLKISNPKIDDKTLTW